MAEPEKTTDGSRAGEKDIGPVAYDPFNVPGFTSSDTTLESMTAAVKAERGDDSTTMDMSPPPVPEAKISGGPAPGPWKPPADSGAVRKSMTAAVNKDRRSRRERNQGSSRRERYQNMLDPDYLGRGDADVGGIPPHDVDRIADAGGEQEAVMKLRFTGLMEGFVRLFDTQNKMLKTMAEMVADHERKIHELHGYLERSRS